MKAITDAKLLEQYERDFPLKNLFSIDIRPYVTLVRFDSGESMTQEGEKIDYLLFVISGRTKLFITQPNGRVSLIDFIIGPCYIGDLELIGAQEHANGVTAVTPCICYYIRIRQCRKKILNDNFFLRNLCLYVSRRAVSESEAFARGRTYSLKTRLANFIRISSHHSLYREPHTETSEYLGVTYRHLLYVFAEFVQAGILTKTDHGYLITDPEALQKLTCDI